MQNTLACSCDPNDDLILLIEAVQSSLKLHGPVYASQEPLEPFS